MICFTAVVQDTQARYYFVGVSCIYFTFINIGVNLLLIVWQSL